MSIQEIKAQITQLPPEEITSLSQWLADLDDQIWDEKIADDLDAGNLDAILGEVDTEYRAGHARPL